MGLFRSNPINRGVSPVTGGLVGSVVQYLVARRVVGKVARVGGIQGVLLGAAASYALNKFFEHRNGHR